MFHWNPMKDNFLTKKICQYKVLFNTDYSVVEKGKLSHRIWIGFRIQEKNEVDVGERYFNIEGCKLFKWISHYLRSQIILQWMPIGWGTSSFNFFENTWFVAKIYRSSIKTTTNKLRTSSRSTTLRAFLQLRCFRKNWRMRYLNQ
jgi:hypothetical protein